MNTIIQKLTQIPYIIIITISTIFLIAITQIFVSEFAYQYQRETGNNNPTEKPRLIDVSEQALEITSSQVLYNADGDLLALIETNRNIHEPKEYVVIEPETMTFKPASHDQFFQKQLLWQRNQFYNYNHYKQPIMPNSYYNFTLPAQNTNERELWSYNHQEKYFIGFIGKKIIGYLDAKGFKDSLTNISPLNLTRKLVWKDENNDNTASMIWQSDKGLFYVNFTNKTFKPLASVNENDKDHTIHSWSIYNWPTSKHRTGDMGILLVQYTDGQIDLFSRKDNLEKIKSEINNYDFRNYNVTLLQEREDYSLNSIYIQATEKPYRQFNYVANFTPGSKHMEYVTNELGITTNILYKYNIALYKIDKATGSVKAIADNELFAATDQTYADDTFTDKIFQRSSAFYPVCTKWLMYLDNKCLNLFRILYSDQRFFASMSPSYILSLIFTAASFYHIRNRKSSIFAMYCWLVFVFLFNLAGLLTYLIFNHCTLDKCHACGKQRHLQSNNCPHCNAPLPKPELKTTDIIKVRTA